jgi:hypothetical protein
VYDPVKTDAPRTVAPSAELIAADQASAQLEETVKELRDQLEENAQRISDLERSLHCARLRQRSLLGALGPFDDDLPEEKPEREPSRVRGEVVPF